MGLAGIETAKRFEIMHFPFHGDTLMVSRTGFTGDLGYELWIRPELALDMWDELYAAGEDYGIQPYGEAATNMARLEAGFIMPDDGFQRGAQDRALRTRPDTVRVDAGLAGRSRKTALQWSTCAAGRKTARTEMER